MKKFICICSVLLGGCDYNIAFPSPTVTVNNTNTSTNTNTNPIDIHIDSHDVINFTPSPGSAGSDGSGNGSPTGPLPIPINAQLIARGVAESNPLLLANSCQDTLGPAAWGFMDLEIQTLRLTDTRWGYLCKRGVCSDPSRDVIAYKATNTDTGVWGVDIIGNHCLSPAFTWNVIGYDAAGKWIFPRQ